jgi:hypothetical protein
MKYVSVVLIALLMTGSAMAGTGECYVRINGKVQGYDCDSPEYESAKNTYCAVGPKRNWQRSEYDRWAYTCH